MAMMLQYSVVKQGFAGLLGMLMAQGATFTKSKFLSLILCTFLRNCCFIMLNGCAQ